VSLWETQARRLLAAPAASVFAIIMLLLGGAAALLFNWGWLFQQVWLRDLSRATHGIVGGTLVASLDTLAIVLVLAWRLAGLVPRHLGLDLIAVARGIAFVAAVWFGAQLICAGAAVAAGDEVCAGTLDIASLVAQMFGNALNEEVFWRGFLGIQLVLLARRFGAGRWAWPLALVASQVAFAVSHIPQRWAMTDLDGVALASNLAFVGWFGVLMCAVYVRTGNLGIAIALHAFANEPFFVFDAPIQPDAMWLAIALVIVWPYLRRLRPRRNTAASASPAPPPVVEQPPCSASGTPSLSASPSSTR
jgi:membrane protease YdiL (CAAX protease family)